MKGVVLSASFFIVLMMLFMLNSWALSNNNLRDSLNRSFKNGLTKAAHEVLVSNEISQDHVLKIIEQEMLLNNKKNISLKMELLGYHKDPLLIRVRILAQDYNNFYQSKILLEETIIEEETINE